MAVYLILIALTLLLGGILPQTGRKRGIYILAMALLLTLVSALRYNHMAGDLKKYHWEFLCAGEYGWADPQLLHSGRNAGFYLLLKLINLLTGGNFQALLILIAAIIQFAVAAVIWRFSPRPWMSYLVFLCMGFFSFGLSAIKQALAMAFVLLSFLGIADKRPKFFLWMMAAAAFIHFPALFVLPVCLLCRLRLSGRVLLGYLAATVIVYLLKTPLVSLIQSVYYADSEPPVYSGGLGNRFWMLLILTLLPLVIRGFSETNLEKLFHFMAVAALVQMLSGFDNIFTRMADYCFQFSLLYIPMVFYPGEEDQNPLIYPPFPCNARSLRLIGTVFSVFFIWFYYAFYLCAEGMEPFRFFWEV